MTEKKITSLSCVKYKEGGFCEVLNGEDDCEARTGELVGNEKLMMVVEKHYTPQVNIWDGYFSAFLMLGKTVGECLEDMQLISETPQTTPGKDNSTIHGISSSNFIASAITGAV